MSSNTSTTTIIPFSDRKLSTTLVLFDVDDTITPARKSIKPEMLQTLNKLRQFAVIGFVGGSNFEKQIEQIGNNVLDLFDYCFAENGLTAYKLGKQLPSASFIGHIGEDNYKKLCNFILHYIADLDIPIKRGTFIEFRNGMINVSPIGRNCSHAERDEFEKFDLASGIRKNFVIALKNKFPELGLTYSIGGQISFDIFPTGWDKTYCLTHINNDEHKFDNIHFFGDKTFEGGNDFEIYNHSSVTGHAVKNYCDTIDQLNTLFPELNQP